MSETTVPRRRKTDLLQDAAGNFNTIMMRVLLDEYGAELVTDEQGNVIALRLEIPIRSEMKKDAG